VVSFQDSVKAGFEPTEQERKASGAEREQERELREIHFQGVPGGGYVRQRRNQEECHGPDDDRAREQPRKQEDAGSTRQAFENVSHSLVRRAESSASPDSALDPAAPAGEGW